MNPDAKKFLELRIKLFRQLESCLNAPDPEKLESLANFIDDSNVPEEFLQSCLCELFYTIQSIINNIPKMVENPQTKFSFEDIFNQCWKIYNILFRRTTITNKEYFENIFKMFSWLIKQTCDKSPELKVKLSELSQQVLIESTENLIKSSDTKLFLEICHTTKFKLMHGYLSGCLLQIITEHKHQHLKIASLCLMKAIFLKMIGMSPVDFSYDFIEKISVDDDQLRYLSRYFAFILPGVLSKIWKLLNVCSNRDYHRLHSRVIVEALKLFYIIIQIIFREGQTFDDPCQNAQIQSMEDPSEPVNESWFEKVSKNLSLIMSSIYDTLVEHPEQEVRLNLLKLSHGLIFRCCSKFVLKFLNILLRIPLNYMAKTLNDSIFIKELTEENELQNLCKEFKESFYVHLLIRSNEMEIKNLLHKEFFTHVKQMPYLLRNITADGKILTKTDLNGLFQMFIGYLLALNRFALDDFLKLQPHTQTLFRTLINLGEFDFKKCPISLISSENEGNFNLMIDGQHHLSRNDLIRALYSLFEFEKRLMHLKDPELSINYLSSIYQLGKCSNLQGFQIMIDHVKHLLDYSDYDPSVILVVNTLLTSIPVSDYGDQLEIHLEELNNVYLRKLNTQDIYVAKSLAITCENTENNFVALSDLSEICSKNNEDKRKEIVTLRNDPKRLYDRKLLQHCLLLKGSALIHLSIKPERSRRKFYERFFIQLIESLGSGHRLVSNVAQYCLVLLGQHFDCGLMEKTQNPKLIVHQMVLDNLDYVYSSFSINLEYSVNHLSLGPLFRYEYDFHTIESIQKSLQIIIGLISEYHKSNCAISSEQMEYLHRLIDQILDIIKYYSIRSMNIDPDDLNRLLEVVFAYEQLISLLYDKDFQSKNMSLMNTEKEDSIDEMIEDLENFVKNLQNQGLDDCEMTDLESADRDEPAETEADSKKDILQSPIIKSRIGDILHLCPMILNDSNITIRLNVLQISLISMNLLRSYEDILLPYVHRLWDSLVKRFSLDFEHPLVMKRAFECLILASELCGDFLLPRIQKEVLPFIIDFLQVRFEKRLDHFRKYRRIETIKTVDYYAEYELLQSFGALASNIKLPSKDLWPMLPTLMFYVCCKGIEKDLQHCSLRSLITLVNDVDPYSVRFYVHLFLEVFYEDGLKTLKCPRKNTFSKFECDCRWKRDHLSSNTIKKYSDSMAKMDQCLIEDLISHLNV